MNNYTRQTRTERGLPTIYIDSVDSSHTGDLAGFQIGSMNQALQTFVDGINYTKGPQGWAPADPESAARFAAFTGAFDKEDAGYWTWNGDEAAYRIFLEAVSEKRGHTPISYELLPENLLKRDFPAPASEINCLNGTPGSHRPSGASPSCDAAG